MNGGTLNFLALYISSIFQSLNFLGPGCCRRESSYKPRSSQELAAPDGSRRKHASSPPVDDVWPAFADDEKNAICRNKCISLEQSVGICL